MVANRVACCKGLESSGISPVWTEVDEVEDGTAGVLGGCLAVVVFRRRLRIACDVREDRIAVACSFLCSFKAATKGRSVLDSPGGRLKMLK